MSLRLHGILTAKTRFTLWSLGFSLFYRSQNFNPSLEHFMVKSREDVLYYCSGCLWYLVGWAKKCISNLSRVARLGIERRLAEIDRYSGIDAFTLQWQICFNPSDNDDLQKEFDLVIPIKIIIIITMIMIMIIIMIVIMIIIMIY